MKISILMVLVCVLVAGCISAVAQKKIDGLVTELLALKAKLKAAQQAHKEGKLTTMELLALSSEVVDDIKSVNDKLIKARTEEGLTWSQILYGIAIFFARGLPSKGLLGFAVNKVVPWRKKE